MIVNPSVDNYCNYSNQLCSYLIRYSTHIDCTLSRTKNDRSIAAIAGSQGSFGSSAKRVHWTRNLAEFHFSCLFKCPIEKWVLLDDFLESRSRLADADTDPHGRVPELGQAANEFQSVLQSQLQRTRRQRRRSPDQAGIDWIELNQLRCTKGVQSESLIWLQQWVTEPSGCWVHHWLRCCCCCFRWAWSSCGRRPLFVAMMPAPL